MVEWSDEARGAVKPRPLPDAAFLRALCEVQEDVLTEHDRGWLLLVADHLTALVAQRDALLQDLRSARAEALREAAEAWRDEGRGVMFNRNGDDLDPAGRVGKWMRDRAEAER